MKIIGIGSAMPDLAVTNDMLSVFLDTNDEWISSRTGIKQRRIISKDSLKELATKASLKAIEDAGLTPKELDFILCSNTVNNYVVPAFSCIVQGEIDAECPCMDLNVACSGFLYALYFAESLIATGKAKNILVLCAEETSRIVDWSDRNTCVLFGDGTAAVVVTEGDSFKSSHLSTQSKVEPLFYQRKLEYNPFVKNPDGNAPLVMNGKEIFKLAVSSALSDIHTVLEKAGMKSDDIDFYLLHQANLRITESVRENLKQPEEKFPHNIEKYGNTSSATIPILLDELYREGKIKTGDKIVLCAFGAGFSTGAAVLEWTK